jgi:Fe-S-cluster containining protein
MNQGPQETQTDPVRKLDPESRFRFRCGPGVSCYTQCCRDVSIALTPYDVLRMKNALGMSSGDFLDRHTIILGRENQLVPLVFLKMIEEDKHCPFVSDEGCRIYDDRPWPCRMFPLDMNADGSFQVIADPKKCKGLEEDDITRVADWLVEQGIVPYDRHNAYFAEITNPIKAIQPDIENPDISKMIFMALYNLDRFREFVFQSSFLKRLEVDEVRLEKIKRSDEELLKFAFDWIKFGVFGQILFRVRPEAAPQPEPAD